MSHLIIPTYGTGFARYATESAYPELWRGLVGLWASSLGPTGLTLRDWSGYQNDGALTNMDAATDWIPTEHGYALDYDGSNDWINVGDIKTTAPATVLMRFKSNVSTGDTRLLSQAAGAGGQSGAFGIGNNSQNFDIMCWNGTGWRKLVNLSSDWSGAWHDLAIVYTGAGAIGYWDGIQQLTDQFVIDFDFSGVDLGIGRDFTGLGFGDTYDGIMGDVSIYNRALTANEIAAMYAGTSPLIPRRRRYVRSPVSLVVTLDSISVTQPGVTPSVSQPTLTISVTQSTITISEKNRV